MQYIFSYLIHPFTTTTVVAMSPPTHRDSMCPYTCNKTYYLYYTEYHEDPIELTRTDAVVGNVSMLFFHTGEFLMQA